MLSLFRGVYDEKTIKVVGTFIENDDKEVLCALRSKDMLMSNYWEFPGEKIEEGETPRDAIIREIKEELDCTIEYIDIFKDNTYEYEEFFVNLIVVKCKLVGGTPRANEHAKLMWLSGEYLESLNWAPADIEAVKKIVTNDN